jgi:hypothetical protein
MTTKEFILSELRQDTIYGRKRNFHFYVEEDIKEFIKILKERIELTLISNKIKWNLNDDINELAGNKLIEEKR